MRRWASIAVFVWAASGCVLRDTQGELYACASDVDCGEGWGCRAGVCRATEADACSSDCRADGRACCDARCVHLARDAKHCGACGAACPTGLTCRQGACVPNDEEGLCGNGLDDDRDGQADCTDSSCPDGVRCGAGTCCHGSCAVERQCTDGKDDDCDGATDCGDSDCEGATCPEGVCAGGSCRGGCHIAGAFVAAGAAFPSVPCLACLPDVSRTRWTPRARYTTTDGCTGALACDGAGACRGRPGETCSAAGDCVSGRCVGGNCS